MPTTPVQNQLYAKTDAISGKTNYAVMPAGGLPTYREVAPSEYSGIDPALVSQVSKPSQYSMDNGVLKENTALDANQTPAQLAQNKAVLGARQSGTQLDPNSVSQSNGNPLTASPITNNGTGDGKNLPATASGPSLSFPNAQGTVFSPILGKQVSPAEAALAEKQASGEKPPQQGGTAASGAGAAIQQATPQNNNQQVSAVSQALANDPGYQKLLNDAKIAQSAATQGESLSQQYQDLLKQYNIPGIDTELLNDKKIINGTEDDIRHEITAANGFATDSQVLALASARNKTLIQNYNTLVAQKSDIMSQINTISGLQEKDRAFAMQAAGQQLQIDQQINDYAQKFISNAQEGYKNVISAIGYNGLYASLQHDPNAVSLAEQTLGLSAGSLATIAAIPNPDAQLKAVQLAQAQLNLQQSTAEEPLKIKQLQASINSSNESTAKSAYELSFQKTHDGLTPEAYAKQQQDQVDSDNKQGQSFLDDAAKYVSAFAGNGKLDGVPVTWGAAFNFMQTKYPDASTETIDNVLKADLYRNKKYGG